MKIQKLLFSAAVSAMAAAACSAAPDPTQTGDAVDVPSDPAVHEDNSSNCSRPGSNSNQNGCVNLCFAAGGSNLCAAEYCSRMHHNDTSYNQATQCDYWVYDDGCVCDPKVGTQDKF